MINLQLITVNSHIIILLFNLFVMFLLDIDFQKVKKSFESYGLKLKIYQIYNIIIKSCDLKHVI